MPVTAIVFAVSLCIDRYYYGEWTVVAYNFFTFNVWKNISTLYGTHPWHWYATEALPAMIGAATPLFVYEVCRYEQQPPSLRMLLFVLCSYIAVFSTNPHKEYRFILPVLSITLLYAGSALHTLAIRDHKAGTSWHKYSIVSIVLMNVCMIIYFCLFHQGAAVRTVEFLSKHLPSTSTQGAATAAGVGYAVHFWLPCHSTPFFSYLHIDPRPELRFFDCAPAFTKPHKAHDFDYTDECSDDALFRLAAVPFLHHYYHLAASNEWTTAGALTQCIAIRQQRQQWERINNVTACERAGGGHVTALPTHVVVMDDLSTELREFLSDHGYRQIAQFFHSHFDAAQYMLVFENRNYARPIAG